MSNRENELERDEAAAASEIAAETLLETESSPELEQAVANAAPQSPEEGAKSGQKGAGGTKMLALDYVEAGNDAHNQSLDQRVTKQLPEGVSSKMLYEDVVHIAWPSLVELTLTQLASMVDLMMVGALGPWAISAVGLTTQPKFLLMTMFMAMNVGATAMVARYKGAGNRDRANGILRQSILLTTVLSIIMSILGYVAAEPLIRFMGAADAQTLEGGTIYLQIQMVGFVFMALTSTVTATLRGVGNSKTAMYYNLTANLVNVVMNYCLIGGNLGFPKMGVAGASLATVIGQCVAFVIAFATVMRGNQYLVFKFGDDFRPDFGEIKKIVNIGIPAMIEQLVMRAGMIIYSKTVASLGTVAFATHQICMNIQALSFMSGQAFAVSATSLMGQSLGKKRPDMAQAYVRRTSRLGQAFAVCLGLIFFFFGGQIIGLYTDESVIIAQGAFIMMLIALIQPLQSSQFILAGALRGAGDTRATAVITFITVLLVRPGLALLFINIFDLGLNGAWYAMGIDQLLRSALVFARFRSGRWKQIAV